MTEPIDVVEALLFASETPVEPDRIREVLELGSPEEARALVTRLKARLDAEDRALMIIEVGEAIGWSRGRTWHPGSCDWRGAGRARGSRARPWKRSPSSPIAN